MKKVIIKICVLLTKSPQLSWIAIYSSYLKFKSFLLKKKSKNYLKILCIEVRLPYLYYNNTITKNIGLVKKFLKLAAKFKAFFRIRKAIKNCCFCIASPTNAKNVKNLIIPFSDEH